MRACVRFLLALFVAVSAGTAAAQQSRTAAGTSPWSLETGIGFMASPDAFLMGFEADYRFGNGFSAGPMLQLGIDDDFIVVSPAAYARYTFDLTRTSAPEGLRALEPYLQGGLGFTYIDLDTPNGFGGDSDDIGFLMNFGFGADYRLTRSISLGSKMLFNILPTDVFDDNFYYSWEVATFRFRF